MDTSRYNPFRLTAAAAHNTELTASNLIADLSDAASSPPLQAILRAAAPIASTALTIRDLISKALSCHPADARQLSVLLAKAASLRLYYDAFSRKPQGDLTADARQAWIALLTRAKLLAEGGAHTIEQLRAAGESLLAPLNLSGLVSKAADAVPPAALVSSLSSLSSAAAALSPHSKESAAALMSTISVFPKATAAEVAIVMKGWADPTSAAYMRSFSAAFAAAFPRLYSRNGAITEVERSFLAAFIPVMQPWLTACAYRESAGIAKSVNMTGKDGSVNGGSLGVLQCSRNGVERLFSGPRPIEGFTSPAQAVAALVDPSTPEAAGTVAAVYAAAALREDRLAGLYAPSVLEKPAGLNWFHNAYRRCCGAASHPSAAALFAASYLWAYGSPRKRDSAVSVADSLALHEKFALASCLSATAPEASLGLADPGLFYSAVSTPAIGDGVAGEGEVGDWTSAIRKAARRVIAKASPAAAVFFPPAAVPLLAAKAAVNV